MRARRTFSFDSFIPGKLASMSLRSFKLVLCAVGTTAYSARSDAPVGVVLVGELLKGLDELVERVLHVHVPDVDPDLVLVREHGLVLLDLALFVAERVPVRT